MKDLFERFVIWIDDRKEIICLSCVFVLLFALAHGAHKHRNAPPSPELDAFLTGFLIGGMK
jgi:hypothetical protein